MVLNGFMQAIVTNEARCATACFCIEGRCTIRSMRDRPEELDAQPYPDDNDLEVLGTPDDTYQEPEDEVDLADEAYELPDDPDIRCQTDEDTPLPPVEYTDDS